MRSLVRVAVSVLSLMAASSVFAADAAAPSANAATSASRSPPPLLRRPRQAKQMKLSHRYAVPLVAYRRADGSLEVRNGGPAQLAAPQAEVNNER